MATRSGTTPVRSRSSATWAATSACTFAAMALPSIIRAVTVSSLSFGWQTPGQCVPDLERDPQGQPRVDRRHHVVDHNAEPAGQPLEAANGPGLGDVKNPEPDKPQNCR